MSARIELARKSNSPEEIIQIKDQAREPCLTQRLLPDIHNLDNFKISRQSMQRSNKKICEVTPVLPEPRIKFEDTLRRPNSSRLKRAKQKMA